MGDTLEYIEGECYWWVDEMNYYLSQGYNTMEAAKMVGEPPLEDCWEML